MQKPENNGHLGVAQRVGARTTIKWWRTWCGGPQQARRRQARRTVRDAPTLDAGATPQRSGVQIMLSLVTPGEYLLLLIASGVAITIGVVAFVYALLRK